MSGKRLLAIDGLSDGKPFTTEHRESAKRWSEMPGPGRLLEIDLADALDVTDRESTDHERYEHAERMLLKWTAEEARLRPALRGEPVLPAQDLSELREAAQRWLPWIRERTVIGDIIDQNLHNALVRLFPDLAKRAA